MAESKQIKEPGATYSAPIADLSHPVILQRDGKPVAAIISIEEYERYRAALREPRELSATEARRTADRAMFRDLVGCAISSSEPEWLTSPEPHWRVPYRTFDGQLLTTIDVHARTGQVLLTEEQRAALLDQVERLASSGHASA